MQIKKIFSVHDPEILLGQFILDGEVIDTGDTPRTDFSEPFQALQLARIQAIGRKEFRPHFHLVRSRRYLKTQEAWVVISGSVEVTVYDIVTNAKVASQIINAGDVSITYQGGHGYKLLLPSVVYEMKTGPYIEQGDKKYIMP